MNGKRVLKRLNGGKACAHRHCGDCATRRGNKRGVRNERHTVNRLLRACLKGSW